MVGSVCHKGRFQSDLEQSLAVVGLGQIFPLIDPLCVWRDELADAVARVSSEVFPEFGGRWVRW